MATFTPQKKAAFDFNLTGTPYELWPCGPHVSASIQAVPASSNTTWRLTVIVSNDPAKAAYENHPSNIVLSSAAQITPAFSVVGYLWYGFKLSTAAGGALRGDVYGLTKDSPA